jgi:hypothetical protein
VRILFVRCRDPRVPWRKNLDARPGLTRTLLPKTCRGSWAMLWVIFSKRLWNTLPLENDRLSTKKSSKPRVVYKMYNIYPPTLTTLHLISIGHSF